MLLFEYVLVLLAAILLSNVINRFIPSISVPVVQIILGACICFLPFGFGVALDPELFFVLFIAPLVFNTSKTADKKSLWELKKPILNMAIILVFVTVIAGGYFVHFLIPAIPLAAAFVLIAALGPTDDVAVASVAKRVNMPPKIMNILQGESIINDASGIVSFQFALAAVVTGTFSFAGAIGKFLIIGFGGILLGLLLTGIKYLFVRWVRSLGMENITIHILIQLLTPFLIYMIAEALGTSGVLAVFAAGIAHSFGRDKLNPETASLNIASQSIWSVLSFTLDGIVFIILGTQLPGIIRTVLQGAYDISTWEILLYIFAVTSMLIIIRLAWSFCTIRKKEYSEDKSSLHKFKASLIFGLSGARGTVTLASVMSIPLLLDNGTMFPQRDLIILISTGVILVSLVITNFILPLLIEKKTNQGRSAAETGAYLEILRNVISQLGIQINSENKSATELVIRSYYGRTANLQHTNHSDHYYQDENERLLRIRVLEWERAHTNDMMEHKLISGPAALHYLDMLDKLTERFSGKRNFFRTLQKTAERLSHMLHHRKRRGEDTFIHEELLTLMEANNHYVLEQLYRLKEAGNNPAAEKLIMEYEMSRSIQETRRGLEGAMHQETDENKIAEVSSAGFQIERDQIQMMFENGRISRDTAKEMRSNISLLELQLKSGN